MKPTDILTLSPLFFIHPGLSGAVASDVWRNQRFQRIAPAVFEAAASFLEPTSVEAALKDGVTEDAIAAAWDAGMLVAEGDPELAAARLWEEHRWSRAAHLLFSQQDLGYTEPTEAPLPHTDLVDIRRAAISSYLAEATYPEPYLATAFDVIALPTADVSTAPDLDALLRRQSARAFAPSPVALQTFADVLFEATANVRIADATKASNDPYFLLNSFYAWLHLYVVVQGVEGIRRGVYQYDPRRHELRAVRYDVADAEILPLVQHQDWIGGSGFCLFYVVQWERYAWVYRHARAYINLLIQLGEIGQEVLQAAYRRGLAGWPTPAVRESDAAALLSLPQGQLDAMYFTKIGVPRGKP